MLQLLDRGAIRMPRLRGGGSLPNHSNGYQYRACGGRATTMQCNMPFAHRTMQTPLAFEHLGKTRNCAASTAAPRSSVLLAWLRYGQRPSIRHLRSEVAVRDFIRPIQGCCVEAMGPWHCDELANLREVTGDLR